MEQALRKGEIAAGEMAQPFYAAAKARGGIHDLFTAKEILPCCRSCSKCLRKVSSRTIQMRSKVSRGLLAALNYARDPKNRDEVIGIVSEPQSCRAMFRLVSGPTRIIRWHPIRSPISRRSKPRTIF